MSRDVGRLRLRHLFEITEARGEEIAAVRGRFQRLAREDTAPRVIVSDNLFQTPEPIAEQMAARFETFGRTLEPSAGLGRLYRAVRRLDSACLFTLVEISPDCCGELYRQTIADETAYLAQGDFLGMDCERLRGPFDSIIMNPPFRMRSDLRHIHHARTLLAPGGRLVTLCLDNQRRREELEPIAASYTALPPQSFKAEATGVSVAIVEIRK